MEKRFLQPVAEAVEGLRDRPNVVEPSPAEIKSQAELYGARTKFGSYNFTSNAKSRSAAVTLYVGGAGVAHSKLTQKRKDILQGLPDTLRLVHEYIRKAPVALVDVTMGNNPSFTPHCSYYVSTYRRESIRLAHMVSQTLFPRADTPGPHFNIICIPEWQEKDRQVLVFPEIGCTYVLGTDYFGDTKKGFLRMAMWHAKQQGMLGLHAGTKIIKARDKDGKLRKLGMVIFGLTGVGKTTHACHNHDLDMDSEGVEIVQDDVAFWRRDGSALGTEKGFYIKTDGLDPKTQPLLYDAATRRDTIFENVMIDYLGNISFDDETLTGNARGIIQKRDLDESSAEGVNLPPVDELDRLIIAFIVRRNNVIPIAAKLTPEQAAAAFMLGESVAGSGRDPRRAGESTREVGANPFIIGDEAQEGNIFYEFVKTHPEKIQCYMLNTGGVGEIVQRNLDGSKAVKQKVTRVQIQEIASIIRSIARDTIQWEDHALWDVKVPRLVEGMDMRRFDLSRYYSQEQAEGLVGDLRLERMRYIEKFAALDSRVRRAAEM